MLGLHTKPLICEKSGGQLLPSIIYYCTYVMLIRKSRAQVPAKREKYI